WLGMPGAGDVIRRLRTDARMSAAELAEASGIARSQIYRIEKGQSPTLETLRKIALALDMTLIELLARIEGDTAAADVIDHPPHPLGGYDVSGSPLPPEDQQLLERLARLCIIAAQRSRRLDTRALFRDLAVGF